MDILSNLKPAKGSTKRIKRVGRGQGSGRGKTATRGHKGQHSRSGSGRRVWFEGGQMPLSRRLPKRGFKSRFRKVFQTVNVEALQKLSAGGKGQSGTVTPELLAKVGLIKKANAPVKILGNGALEAKLDVAAHAFSKSAAEKIAKAGGVTRVITAVAKG